MQSQDAQVPIEAEVSAPNAAPKPDKAKKPVVKKGKPKPKKVAVKTAPAPEPQADKPLTPAERAAKLQDLKGKLANEVEPFLRSFQEEITAINTDAAYEVKKAAEAFVLDATEGISYFAKMLVEPGYTPDEWKASVMRGLQEDVPLPVFKLGEEDKPAKPKKAKGERRIKAEEIADVIEVDGEPVAARN